MATDNSNCCEPNLIRIYWPGLTPESQISAINESTLLDPIPAQALIDCGIMYLLMMPDGSYAMCAAMVYGNVNLKFTVDSTVIEPIPVPIFDFVGGRPPKGPKGPWL